MLEMAPPKINMPLQEMYAQYQIQRARMMASINDVQHQWKQTHEPLDGKNSFYTL